MFLTNSSDISVVNFCMEHLASANGRLIFHSLHPSPHPLPVSSSLHTLYGQFAYTRSLRFQGESLRFQNHALASPQTEPQKFEAGGSGPFLSPFEDSAELAARLPPLLNRSRRLGRLAASTRRGASWLVGPMVDACEHEQTA